MTRWLMLIVAFPVVLLLGFGGVYFLTPDGDGGKGRSLRQFAQLSLPWTTEKKEAPDAPKPPATATPAPTPAPAPASEAQSAAPAPSAQAVAQEAKGPGWAVNCTSNAGEKGLTCRMSQTIVARTSGRTLTDVAFLLAPESKNPELLLQLPLGLYLPAGATYQVDESAPQRVNIRACDLNGCYARTIVSPETISALLKGKQIKIDFQNLAEKPVSVPLSLDGFASAYDKIRR